MSCRLLRELSSMFKKWISRLPGQIKPADGNLLEELPHKVLVGSHHKTGTVWMRKVFSCVCESWDSIFLQGTRKIYPGISMCLCRITVNSCQGTYRDRFVVCTLSGTRETELYRVCSITKNLKRAGCISRWKCWAGLRTRKKLIVLIQLRSS